MSDGERIADAIALQIADIGQDVILRRQAGTGPVVSDLPCRAIVSGYQPVQLIGNIDEGDRKVTISNREISERQWPGTPGQVQAPRRGDIVLVDGKTTVVQSCESRSVGDVVVRHDMRVRGA